MAQTLKKISVKTVVGVISAKMVAALKEHGKAMPVMRVIGLATGSKTGTTQFGNWTSLTGAFEATNLDTGEVSVSQNLLLPMGFCEQGALALQSENVNQLAVAVDVYVKYFKFGEDDKYEYTIESHNVAPDAVDPLANLRAAVPPAPLRLTASAPVQEEIPASENDEVFPPEEIVTKKNGKK